MKEQLINIFYESARVKKAFIDANSETVMKCAKVMAEAIQKGNKLLFFGNGGSAADASHLAAEFVNRFTIDRPAMAAIALTTDASILTSISNDSDFQYIFSRQVEALGRSGDIAFGISTSGNSANVINAITTARGIGIYTVTLTGGTGGSLKEISDLNINVATRETPRIQETHITIGHALCHLVEKLVLVG